MSSTIQGSNEGKGNTEVFIIAKNLKFGVLIE